MRVKSRELFLFADYFQFYIQDEAATGDLSNSWNEEATARMLAVAPGAIGIATARNMHVPVALEIHDQDSGDDISAWDHVVEASLHVTSGRIVIAGCTDYFSDAVRVEVPSGSHRVRVFYGLLDTLSEDGLSGDDHYKVQLWPGLPTAARILKHRA